MASVTCEVCGMTVDAAAPPMCPECGAPLPRQRAAAKPPDAPAAPPTATSDAVAPSGRVPQPAPGECDHAGARPGAVICPSCGQPVALAAHTAAAGAAAARRRVVLTFPWGDVAMAPGEALEIGREVGPFQRQLEPFGTVGRRHATLRVTAACQLLVRDHSSMNGTFVDARRCSPAADREVPDGAELRFSQRLNVTVRFAT